MQQSSLNGDVVSYLCHHGEGRRAEYVDKLSPLDVDLRQEAAMRLVVAMQNCDIDYSTDEAFIDNARANEGLTVRALAFARADLLRNLNGRKGHRLGHIKRLDTLTNILMIDEQDFFDDAVFMTDGEKDRLREQLTDRVCEECMEHIEEDYGGQIRTLYANATTEQREAVCLLIDIQRRKDAGITVSDDATRSKLKRLRKETGWALRTTIL